MRIFLVYILLLHQLVIGIGQADTVKANQYIDKALNNLLKLDNSCLQYLDSAKTIYKNLADNEMLSYCYKIASVYEYNRGNTISALTYNKKSLELLRLVNYNLPLDYIALIADNGVFQSDLGNNFIALNKYLECLYHPSFQRLDSIIQSTILTNAGHEYNLLKDYQSALSAYRRANRLLEHSNNELKYYINISVASCLCKINNYNDAWKILDSLSFFLFQGNDTLPGRSELKAFHHQIKGECFFQVNNIDEAIAHMKKSSSLYIGQNNHLYAGSVLDIVDYYHHSCMYDSAKQYLNSFFENYVQSATQKLNYFLCKSEILNAKLQIAQGNPCEAALALNNATKFNSYNIQDNKRSHINAGLAIQAEEVKLFVLKNHPRYADEMSITPNVLNPYSPILNLLLNATHQALSDKAKYARFSKGYAAIDEALLDICSPGGLVSPPQPLLGHYWSDLTKGGVLSEQIARNRLIRRIENDSLYKEYIELTSEIHALRKQLINNKVQNINPNESFKYEELLLQKGIKLAKLEQETDFDHQIIDFDSFKRDYLSKQSAALQIFSGDNNYIFIFHGSEEFNNIKIQPKKDVNTLLDKLIEIQSSDKYTVSKIVKASNDLYTAIFPENIKWSDYDHLTIVADGQFNKLAFETLCIHYDTSIISSSSAPYLIKSIPISYSLGLHLNKSFEDLRGSKIAGFAPTFDTPLSSEYRDCTNDVFGRLSCNKKEIKAIHSTFKASQFIDSRATIQNLDRALESHDIIHLATHACIDTVNYYNSAIILQDGPLYVSDMYNMNWYNKTVVLSACNTAQGQIISGEGIFNFARTLTELGCKDVIVSLWPLDDCQTANFIERFYNELQTTSHTALALQRARISYLENANKLQALPMFWAPLILITNDINIAQLPSDPWKYYGLTALLIITGLGYYRYKSRMAA